MRLFAKEVLLESSNYDCALPCVQCIAFFGAGLAKKVYAGCAASTLFVIFHLLVTLENFPTIS